MEKIRINNIEMKGPNKTICVVRYGYNNNTGSGEREATLNTKWQSQEVNYLEKDVGLGGEVSVLIEQKGQYTNITKVDFDSAVKGNAQAEVNKALDKVYGAKQGTRALNGQEQRPATFGPNAKRIAGERELMPTTSKDKSIIAQCLVKAVIGNMLEKDINVKTAVEMYKEALELQG